MPHTHYYSVIGKYRSESLESGIFLRLSGGDPLIKQRGCLTGVDGLFGDGVGRFETIDEAGFRWHQMSIGDNRGCRIER